MKVNFEKKHLYIIFGILVLLFSSAYVIAQASFTSPAWTPEKQSHGILYTDIITSKSSTALREVNVEADLIAKGAISLGGVKRTSWPSGGGGSDCIVLPSSGTATPILFEDINPPGGYIPLQGRLAGRGNFPTSSCAIKCDPSFECPAMDTWQPMSIAGRVCRDRCVVNDSPPTGGTCDYLDWTLTLNPI